MSITERLMYKACARDQTKLLSCSLCSLDTLHFWLRWWTEVHISMVSVVLGSARAACFPFHLVQTAVVKIKRIFGN